MDIKQALTILQALADGVDPHTGEVYPPESPYQKADTVRALFVAIRQLESAKGSRAASTKGDNPKKAGSAWSDDEDEALKAAYESHSTIAELSEAHQRSKGAIRSRLIKLGLLEP